MAYFLFKILGSTESPDPPPPLDPVPPVATAPIVNGSSCIAENQSDTVGGDLMYLSYDEKADDHEPHYVNGDIIATLQQEESDTEKSLDFAEWGHGY